MILGAISGSPLVLDGHSGDQVKAKYKCGIGGFNVALFYDTKPAALQSLTL